MADFFRSIISEFVVGQTYDSIIVPSNDIIRYKVIAVDSRITIPLAYRQVTFEITNLSDPTVPVSVSDYSIGWDEYYDGYYYWREYVDLVKINNPSYKEYINIRMYSYIIR